MSGALLLALVACAPAAPAGRVVDDEAGGYRATLSSSVGVAAEYDSNARRLPEVPADGEGAGAVVMDQAKAGDLVGDSLLRFEANLGGRVERPGFTLSFDGALGGKLFYEEASERMAAAQGSVSLDAALPFELRAHLGTFGKLRGQASGSRGYAVERTEAFLSRALVGGLSVRGGLVGQVFHSGDTPVFSSAGGGPLVGLSWLLSREERADVALEAELRCFPFGPPVLEGAEASDLDPDLRRCDAPLRASLSFTSARRLFLSAGYVGERNLSNSLGESYTRHRLWGMAATRLPFELTVAARGSLQLTRYDDGISLGQRLFLAEDDESQNSLQLSLSRPWFGGLDVEARLAWYGNEFAKGGVRFSRTTASLGLRAEL